MKKYLLIVAALAFVVAGAVRVEGQLQRPVAGPQRWSGGYALGFSNSAAASPADSTTYFVGHPSSGYLIFGASEFAKGAIQVPKAGMITGVIWDIDTDGTVASSENVSLYVRKNNTTDMTLTTASSWASANVRGRVGDQWSMEVDAGDLLAVKIVTPAWATNPTFVFIRGTIYIE
jgi:hypothetical protein